MRQDEVFDLPSTPIFTRGVGPIEGPIAYTITPVVFQNFLKSMLQMPLTSLDGHRI